MNELYANKQPWYRRRRTYVIVAVVVLTLATVVFLRTVFTPTSPAISVTTEAPQTVVNDRPVNIALDFYEAWRSAAAATTTNPYTEGVASSSILSESLRQRLLASQNRAGDQVDPVICQASVPSAARARMIHQTDTEASVLVYAREPVSPTQTVIDLKKQNDGWFITEITCGNGEVDTPREFSFEQTGQLLKDVPPPLDASLWHIIFTENNIPGHFAPLTFTADSQCIDSNGATSTCAPDSFRQEASVKVQGQMTDTGVTVSRLEFLE